MIITLTGPRSIGKTTISKSLAKNLNLRYVSSDEIGEKITKKSGGLDKSTKSGEMTELIKKEGYSLIEKEYDEDNFVFDLSGGSISSIKVPEASARVRSLAKNRSFVVGLLPDKDRDKSIKFLFEREKERIHFKGMSKKKLLEKVSNDYDQIVSVIYDFCNIIIYTLGKEGKEIIKEIKNNIPSEGGWQVNIEYFQDYVIKTPKTSEEIRNKIGPYLIEKGRENEINKTIKKMKDDWKESVKIISKSKIPKSLLGEIEFIGKSKIKQKKAIVLQNEINKLYMQGNLLEINRLIKELLNLIITLWKYGIHEKTGKMFYEFGLVNNHVILLDFGEITDDKATAINQISKKYWNKENKRIPEEVLKLFFAEADRVINIDNFNKNWMKRG